DVDPELTLIGRSADCAVRVKGEGISRKHARVVADGDELFLEDLGSTNGTFVNGARVARHPLADGDKIQMGEQTILKFGYHDPVEETFQRQMYESALRDGLTRIFNRKYVLDRLESELTFVDRHKLPLP